MFNKWIVLAARSGNAPYNKKIISAEQPNLRRVRGTRPTLKCAS